MGLVLVWSRHPHQPDKEKGLFFLLKDPLSQFFLTTSVNGLTHKYYFDIDITTNEGKIINSDIEYGIGLQNTLK